MLRAIKEEFLVPGFLASGLRAGIKKGKRLDMAMIYSQRPAKAAGLFTTNAIKAAPVLWDMERIKEGMARAIIANSGIANACTGREGLEDTEVMAKLSAEALDVKKEEVLVASTGIIGQRLPMKKVEEGIRALAKTLSPDGLFKAAKAMMTTDTFPKISYRKKLVGDKEITLAGIAKGAGMINPKMATMLSFILTDADIEKDALKTILEKAVDSSFNLITVDGCTSTNDTVIMLANGYAGNSTLKKDTKEYRQFKEMLNSLLLELAQMIVKDGEGSTKLIKIEVEGAKTTEEAKRIAMAVANSNLVKTAFFGEDPNWGRILAAIGSSGVSLYPEDIDVSLEQIPVVKGGVGVGKEEEAVKIIKKRKFTVVIDLNRGNKKVSVYTTDLSPHYVKLNAKYS